MVLHEAYHPTVLAYHEHLWFVPNSDTVTWNVTVIAYKCDLSVAAQNL